MSPGSILLVASQVEVEVEETVQEIYKIGSMSPGSILLMASQVDTA